MHVDEDDASICKTPTPIFGCCGRCSYPPKASDDLLDPIKSNLSVDYVRVLCSYLDLHCHESGQQNDRGGWDVRIEPVLFRNDWKSKPELYIQLKGVSSPKYHNNYVSFELDAKTYRKLRNVVVKDRTLFCILCLDEDTSRWVECDGESLHLRRIMYWCKPETYKEIPESQQSITLRIPLKNVFNKEALHKMIEILSRDEVFGNEL